MSAAAPLVGYYVHHQGSGHRHRAVVLARALRARGVEVTGLSSATRPDGWTGEWMDLARDDTGDPVNDVTAHGRLHWVPQRHAGLASRMGALSAWLVDRAPGLVVSDVSQEVSVLARLHGVPVVSVLLPGRRDDAAHALGLEISADIVSFWPSAATGMSPGLPRSVARRLRPLGGLSRFATVPRTTREGSARAGDGVRRGVVLAGSGGGAGRLLEVARAAAAAHPDWSWQVLGGERWVDDPWSALCKADVVVTHTGQNAVAEVAAARVPAVVVPLARPFDEQLTTARVLDAGHWPAVAVGEPGDGEGWTSLLDTVAELDSGAWGAWVDGDAAERFADVVSARLAGG